MIRGGGYGDWHIIEPNPEPVEGCQATFIKGFFPSDKFKIENKKFDCIVHSNTWEHMYDPIAFLKEIKKMMQIGTYMVFSIPDFRGQLENHFTSMMNFEHTIYLSDHTVESLLNMFGMQVIVKKSYGDFHSVFYVVKNVSDKMINVQIAYENAYEHNKNAFDMFFAYHEKLVQDWNKKMMELKTNIPESKIYLFGAHITSQYYLAYGLNKIQIETILDNNTYKQGKRVSGTTWIVESPQILREDKFPIVILPQNPYKNEVKKDIIENINKNTVFIE